MITIKSYLEQRKLHTASDDTYTHITEWETWYAGFVEKFHKYNIYNGTKYVAREMERLNMAKTICEDWASLILNERVQIRTNNNFDKTLQEILAKNNFYRRANQLVELAFAFGTGAFVEYLDADGEVVIDYVRAGMIYPLSWENGYINECAFGSTRETANGKQIYLQIHRLGEGKTYVIENHMVDEDGNELPLPEDMAEEVETGSSEPLFQVFYPNIVNNIDIDSPMGISVFANAISQIKCCDVIYDSYINEYVTGRRRILVPLNMAKILMGENGTTKPVFDAKETVFYAIPDDRNGNTKIESMDISIRAQEHDLGMEKALDMLSFKCGLGTGRYKFVAGGVKTATEVISEKSELYQQLKKHENVIGEALTGMVHAIAYLCNKKVKKVDIDFDDSIIEDKKSERETDKADVAMGVMRLDEYRAKWYGETPEQAKANLPVPMEMEPEPVGE